MKKLDLIRSSFRPTHELFGIRQEYLVVLTLYSSLVQALQGIFAYQIGGDWNVLDPEVSGLLVEANNFASGMSLIIGWLTLHDRTPCKFSFALHDTFNFYLITPRDVG